MSAPADIDIAFDFRSDTPPGKDPDARSPRLRLYHQQLWSKPLPTGGLFELTTTKPGVYLHHKSDRGEFSLSSDSVIPTFVGHARLAPLLAQMPPQEIEEFHSLSYTIGGMMVFPSNVVGRRPTINGARGIHPKIRDRFDLTVECIRRYYKGIDSPLSDTLKRYSEFFALFGDFRGYVDFFLLQDLVDPDYSAVKFFQPCRNFEESPVPNSADAYRSYSQAAATFIRARASRMAIGKA